MQGGHEPIRLGMDFFQSLNGDDKGYFGEKIVGFYLRDYLTKDPAQIFPELEGLDSSDIYNPTPINRFFTFIQGKDGIIELESRASHTPSESLVQR